MRVNVRVALLDAEPSGLATMLAGLLEANLAGSPDRSRLVRPGVVELEAIDAEVTVTVRTRPGWIEIANGSASPRADVGIHASSHDLLELSAVPLRLGFPDPFGRRGRAMLGGVLGGRVRISGMLWHPIMLSRFARLLSVA